MPVDSLFDFSDVILSVVLALAVAAWADIIYRILPVLNRMCRHHALPLLFQHFLGQFIICFRFGRAISSFGWSFIVSH